MTTLGVQGRAETSTTGTIGVIVVNYGSHTMIADNLRRFEPLANNVRVVIVDNFSTVAEVEAITALGIERGWHVVCNPTNEGFGAAVNRGAQQAMDLGCDVFLLLNPDASISTEALEKLRTASIAEPLALISPTITKSDGTVGFTSGQISIQAGGLRPSSSQLPGGGYPWITGACLVVHRDLWQRVGGFAEDYFLYWEDVDFSFRCLAAGGHTVVRSDLHAVHDPGGTQGTASGKSPTYFYYNCRNRLLFAAKYLSGRDQLRWVLTTPRDVRWVLRRGVRAQYRDPRRAILPVLMGSASGVIGMLRSHMASSSAAVRAWHRLPQPTETNAGGDAG